MCVCIIECAFDCVCMYEYMCVIVNEVFLCIRVCVYVCFLCHYECMKVSVYFRVWYVFCVHVYVELCLLLCMYVYV